jgi:polyisoprenoid-binding protein YceI
MKTLRLPALTLSLSLLLPLTAAEPEAQTVTWEGSMPAKTHNGVIHVKSLDASVTGEGKLESLKVVLDMTTIADTDIKKEKKRKKLENHLKSGDFFHVAEHPTASFVMKESKAGTATGDLTIRGISEEITIPLAVKKNKDGQWNLTSTFTFNRQKFNVNYQNRGIFGTAKNKLIRDKVTVGVDLVLQVND